MVAGQKHDRKNGGGGLQWIIVARAYAPAVQYLQQYRQSTGDQRGGGNIQKAAGRQMKPRFVKKQIGHHQQSAQKCNLLQHQTQSRGNGQTIIDPVDNGFWFTNASGFSVRSEGGRVGKKGGR